MEAVDSELKDLLLLRN